MRVNSVATFNSLKIGDSVGGFPVVDKGPGWLSLEISGAKMAFTSTNWGFLKGHEVVRAGAEVVEVETLTLVPSPIPSGLDWDLSPSYHNDFFFAHYADLKRILGEPNDGTNPKSAGFKSWSFVLKGTESRVTVYKHYSIAWHIGYHEKQPRAFEAMKLILAPRGIEIVNGDECQHSDFEKDWQ